jgi:hypothetical protein
MEFIEVQAHISCCKPWKIGIAFAMKKGVADPFLHCDCDANFQGYSQIRIPCADFVAVTLRVIALRWKLTSSCDAIFQVINIAFATSVVAKIHLGYVKMGVAEPLWF